MDHCRVCNAEIKPHQMFCPKCGAKLPLLNKEELRGFREFKKKFRPLFFISLLTILILVVLFFVKTSQILELSYIVKETSPELKTIDLSTDCTKEDYSYFIKFVEPVIYKGTLELIYYIENFENLSGTFEYTLTVTDKLRLEEQQKTSEVFLDAYGNKTVSVHFEEVEKLSKLKYFHQVKPPKKIVCETKTGHIIVTEEKEITRTKQEKVYKSLFELIF